jgi:hypothetical protein
MYALQPLRSQAENNGSPRLLVRGATKNGPRNGGPVKKKKEVKIIV